MWRSEGKRTWWADWAVIDGKTLPVNSGGQTIKLIEFHPSSQRGCTQAGDYIRVREDGREEEDVGRNWDRGREVGGGRRHGAELTRLWEENRTRGGEKQRRKKEIRGGRKGRRGGKANNDK